MNHCRLTSVCRVHFIAPRTVLTLLYLYFAPVSRYNQILVNMSDSEQEKAEPKSSTPGEKTGKSKPALGSRNSPVVDTLPELIDIDQVLVSSQGNADAKYSSLPLGTQHTAGTFRKFRPAIIQKKDPTNVLMKLRSRKKSTHNATCHRDSPTYFV